MQPLLQKAAAKQKTISLPFLILAITLTLALLITLCLLAPRMRAVRHDTSANFWYAITGVDIGIRDPHVPFPADVVEDQGRFVYGAQYPFYSFPDLPYECVSETEAGADLPHVRLALEKRLAANDPDDVAAAAFKKWNTLPNPYLYDLPTYLYAERLEHADLRPRITSSPIEFRDGLKHVAQADHFYWATFLFEALHLPAVVWFVIFPYIRRAPFLKKLLRLAALPLLLMLPCWFGYTNPASPAFPRGGILYPFLIGPSIPWHPFDWEFTFLAHLPPFLAPITQGRLVTFPDYYSLTQSVPYLNGPVKVAIYSLTLAILVAIAHLTTRLIKKLRTRQPRGFPVEIVHTPTLDESA